MNNLYQPTDPSLIDRQNQYWRTKANYDEVQKLYFELLYLDLDKIRADYVKRWQKQAAISFRTRERDRDDGKYPWIAIDPVYDFRRTHKLTRRIDLSSSLITSRLIIPFTCVGRLIRQGSILYRTRQVHKLALPIPIPAEYARQVMEQEWNQVKHNWFLRYQKYKEQAANIRAYLAEALIHSNAIVIQGARFNNIVNHKYDDLISPKEVGQLLGCIDYFKLCWQEFHEAEQDLATVVKSTIVTGIDYPSTSDRVLLLSKYYPQLGEHSSVKNFPKLAAEWYSDLARLGVERINYYTAVPYEAANNKVEFLTCLGDLLTEAEKYSHLRGYGYRQYYAPSDLTPSKEAQLEISGNAALRAVRNWHTEASLPSVERFVHRAYKIELWQNEQHQLTTLGLDDEDWREIYDKLFIGLRRALYHTDEGILRTAYTELGLLLPTLHTRWMPRLDESTDEEDTINNLFSPSDLWHRLPYCEFVPLQPLNVVSSQRDVCLMAWLMTHINVKEWYVWQALKLLAGRLKEPEPETPISFQPQPPKPKDLETKYISTYSHSHLSSSDIEGPLKEKELVSIHASDEATVPLIWQSLLTGELSVGGFFDFLNKCGLIDTQGQLTGLGRGEGLTKARKAPWAGAMQALMQADLLDSNVAAVCRALADPSGRIGIKLNEGTLRTYSTKANSYLQLANRQLDGLGFLRK